MPIQQLDLSAPLRLAKPVTTAFEDASQKLTLGNLTRQGMSEDLQIQKMMGELEKARTDTKRTVEVNRILSEGGDPQTTHQKLMAIDPDAAEKYRAKVNADALQTAPDVQQTPQAVVGMAPTFAAAIPDTLDGTMGATPAPQTTEGDRMITAPSKPRSYLTVGGTAESVPTKSAGQVLQAEFEKLKRQKNLESENRSAETAARIREQKAANEVEVPFDLTIPNIGKIAKGAKIDKSLWDNLINLAKPEKPTVITPHTVTTAEGVMQFDPAKNSWFKIGDRPPSASAANGTEDDAKVIAQAIINGDQPPVLTGLYRLAGPVKAELERAKFDLTTATRDWNAIQKHLSTLNGAQQERLRQAVSFTADSLDQIDSLYQEWLKVGPASGFKILNKGALKAAKQLPGKPGEVATNLEAQINDLTSELGTVYKGGNSSTDESLRLASENLRADWNEQTFKRALGQIRTNLQIRKNSINSSMAAGVSPNSRYNPQAESGEAPEGTVITNGTEKMVKRGGKWVKQ